METIVDYDKIIDKRAETVFAAMQARVSHEDMLRIRDAFELARHAHSSQKRKTGEPYILHPIAVASICAKELMLDANPVIAAFLHDVVEDTDFTIEDIESRFGNDVAFLVRVVTKQKKTNMSSQSRWTTTNRCSTQCNMTSARSWSNLPTVCTTCAHSTPCAPTSR